MTAPLAYILTASARGPLGLTARQVAMCLRARKSQPVETRYLDRDGHPIAVGQYLPLPDTVHGYDRLVRMAAPALTDAWMDGLDGPVPLVLALPAPGRADDDPRFEREILGALSARTRLPLDVRASLAIRADHAGFALAMEAAIAILSRPSRPRFVMVGGVDSYLHPGVLEALDDGFRLHTPSNENGFVPAEGAGFALLTREASREITPIAAVRRVALGLEETVGTELPNVGRAMTHVLRAMREDGPIPWVLSDVTGEHHRVREWTMAKLRALDPATRDDRPSDELGDLGAASGPTLLAVACSYFAARCAPAREVVIALSADGRERGAIRVTEDAS